MIECKKFLTMERVKVHRELIQHLKAFTYKNEWHKGLMYVACLHVREGLCTISLLLCQQDKILNIEDLILIRRVLFQKANFIVSP